MKDLSILFCIIFCLITSLTSSASDTNDHKHTDSHIHKKADNKERNKHEHHQQGFTEINDAIAQQAGIVIDKTGPQRFHQTSTVFGRLTTAPEHTSHVRARFPGIVHSVAVNIGDKVSTGDLLAIIESNESLKRYDVRAPINGTIIQRHANAGEMTQEQTLFSISSFESLWAELRIFPTQQKSFSINQAVQIIAGGQRFDTHISHLLPAEDSSPYLIARAKISNKLNGWFPGLMVEGRILLKTFDVPIAIKKSALQTLDNRTGIFVKEHNGYRFTALVLGRRDQEFIEVLSGAQTNTEYVTENSYLIKADLEKSEAEHEH